jgi:hypothetical protein
LLALKLGEDYGRRSRRRRRKMKAKKPKDGKMQLKMYQKTMWKLKGKMAFAEALESERRELDQMFQEAGFYARWLASRFQKKLDKVRLQIKKLQQRVGKI